MLPALAAESVDDPAADVAAPDFEVTASLKVFAALAKSGWLSNHCETSACRADKPPCHDEPDPHVPLEPAAVDVVPVDPDADVTEVDDGSVTLDCVGFDDEPDPDTPLELAAVDVLPVDPDPGVAVTDVDDGSVTAIDCAALDSWLVWSVAVTVSAAVGCPVPLYDEVNVNPLFASAAVSVMLLPLKVLWSSLSVMVS